MGLNFWDFIICMMELEYTYGTISLTFDFQTVSSGQRMNAITLHNGPAAECLPEDFSTCLLFPYLAVIVLVTETF